MLQRPLIPGLNSQGFQGISDDQFEQECFSVVFTPSNIRNPH
jgi:hypothetical protein